MRALTIEPVDPETDQARLSFRRALVSEIGARLATAREHGHLADTDPALAAPAIVGALLAGLLGPLAPAIAAEEPAARSAVQALALQVLRGVGIVDARARGLVVQAKWPASEKAVVA
jgi:hypothetical protein